MGKGCGAGSGRFFSEEREEAEVVVGAQRHDAPVEGGLVGW